MGVDSVLVNRKMMEARRLLVIRESIKIPHRSVVLVDYYTMCKLAKSTMLKTIAAVGMNFFHACSETHDHHKLG